MIIINIVIVAVVIIIIMIIIIIITINQPANQRVVCWLLNVPATG